MKLKVNNLNDNILKIFGIFELFVSSLLFRLDKNNRIELK